MTTRRDIITSGLGLAGIIAAGKAPAAIVRSMVAARSAAMGKSGGGGWVNPYITDGLIAMWDGEWNAGGGVHDANSDIWKDLVGSRDWELTSNGFWREDSLEVKGLSATQPFLPKVYTLECVSFTWSGRHMLLGYGIGNNNPSLIQGLITIADLSGFQCSFTYPYANVTKWVECDVRQKGSVSVVYEDYNEQSTETKNAYCNGVESSATKSGSNFWYTGGQSSIGWNSDVTTWLWYGQIYCIRMYSRQLTESEVLSNYAIDKARFNLP